MNGDEGSVFVAWLAIGMVFFGLIATAVVNKGWQKDAVERGLAMYCPDDGKWAWKGECEND